MENIFIDFWNTHSSLIINILYKTLITVVVIFASRISAKITGKIIEKTCSVINNFDETLLPVIKVTVSYSIYAVCTVIILDLFGVNTASIITLLGAAGIAVGLALKDTLSNIASGIMLLILRPFRKDDFIEFSSIAGTVKEISLFTTILETPDGIFISAPNTSIWGVPLKNYTINGKRRMDLIASISYSDSIDKAFDVMKKIIEEEPRFYREPEPQIMVHSMADSAINIQLRAWTSVDDFWNVKWDKNRLIKERIEAAGLTIPFPQQDVYIKSAMPEPENKKKGR